MSSAFITALHLGFLTVKNSRGYTCACGLSIGISVDGLAITDSILKQPDLLQAAHLKHHKEHFGAARLIMQNSYTAEGEEIPTEAKAFCSCGYKEPYA